MEYTIKSVICKYLDYESLMKMYDVDPDFINFVSATELYNLYFPYRSVSWTSRYESLGFQEIDENFCVHDIFPEDIAETLKELTLLKKKKEENFSDMMNGSTTELLITYYDEDANEDVARYHFDNVVKFLELYKTLA